MKRSVVRSAKPIMAMSCGRPYPHRNHTVPPGGRQKEVQMFRRVTLLAIPLLLCGTLARAATLVTPSVNTTNVNNSVDCRVVNAGSKPITVLIELVNQDGVVVADGQFDIPVGGARAVDLTDTAASTSCRFSGNFTAKTVRGSVSVADESLRTISIAPAY